MDEKEKDPLPSLRARRGDVALPVRSFIEKFNRLLGLSRQLLHYKLRKYKMKREDFKD